MAVTQVPEQPWWARQALPYGAAALVTIAAIISAWPIYLMPAFPYLALGLVLLGTPASMYLRSTGADRRLLNLGMVGVALLFFFAIALRLPLPQAGGDLWSVFVTFDDRDAIALVIQAFLTVAMLRSFTLLTDRDLVLSVIPALSTILLSAIAVRNASVIVGLLLFFLGALYLLAFNHGERWAVGVRARRRLRSRRRLLVLANAVAATWLKLVPITLAVSVAFGWINLPRLLMKRYGSQADLLIALKVYQLVAPGWVVPDNSINLGSGRSLRKTVLFRVDSPADALWRASTLDTYTGSGWSNSPPRVAAGDARSRRAPRTRPRSQSLDSRDGEWRVGSHDPGLLAGVPSSELKQVFHLAAPMQGVLVAAYEAQSLRGRLWHAKVSDSSVLGQSAPMRPGASYGVISRRKAPPGVAVYRPRATLPATERERLLSLPRLPQRTRRLARRITAGERSDLHRALALNAYLQREFVYRDRVTPPPAGVDHVDYFLHHMDGAYCDYFASALAVLARLNGLPARVVTGFRSDEVETETGWWVVREKHAHSWVEVFLDGYGWLELDPSPPVEAAPPVLERATKTFGRAVDAIRRAAGAPFRALAAIPGWRWKAPAGLAALALLLLGVRRARRERPPSLPRAGDTEQLQRYAHCCYERMCRWLRTWGLPKAPDATASEYARWLGRTLGPQAAPMRDIVSAYLAAEYGGRRLEPAEAGDLAQRMVTVLGRRKFLLRRTRRPAPRDGPLPGGYSPRRDSPRPPQST
ncbi:MAG TPA: transglutaminase domain-containing protein [Armatimonadota bacterium]|nr:transglutaminase domain-containing protein [Armatimonadota bacterium]